MPFSKGVSGNISGRPKDDAAVTELKKLCKEQGPTAIETLIYWMNQRKNPKASIVAAKEILDRGFGKAAQSVELSGKDGGPLQAVINIVKN